MQKTEATRTAHEWSNEDLDDFESHESLRRTKYRFIMFCLFIIVGVIARGYKQHAYTKHVLSMIQQSKVDIENMQQSVFDIHERLQRQSAVLETLLEERKIMAKVQQARDAERHEKLQDIAKTCEAFDDNDREAVRDRLMAIADNIMDETEVEENPQREYCGRYLETEHMMLAIIEARWTIILCVLLLIGLFITIKWAIIIKRAHRPIQAQEDHDTHGTHVLHMNVPAEIAHPALRRSTRKKTPTCRYRATMIG